MPSEASPNTNKQTKNTIDIFFFIGNLPPVFLNLDYIINDLQGDVVQIQESGLFFKNVFGTVLHDASLARRR